MMLVKRLGVELRLVCKDETVAKALGNRAQGWASREGATVVSTSTRNFPNRLGKNTNVFLASAELAAIASRLGKLPTVAGSVPPASTAPRVKARPAKPSQSTSAKPRPAAVFGEERGEWDAVDMMEPFRPGAHGAGG